MKVTARADDIKDFGKFKDEEYDNRHRYCKGCKWEYDFKGCKNEYKDSIPLKHKDGTMQVDYCAWKQSKIK